MLLRKSLILGILLLFLLLFASGCGQEAAAVDGLESSAVISTSQHELPAWLLLTHRSKSLSDEQRGFVVAEPVQKDDQQESEEAEENGEDEKSAGNESNASKSSSTVDAGTSTSNSGRNVEDNLWDRTITGDQGPGTFEYKVKVNLD